MLPSAIKDDEKERYRQLVQNRLFRLARGTLIAIGLLPWWLPWARAYLPLGPVGAVFDQLFIVVCHRQPERTLSLAEVAMPLCTRCAGIFLGLALAAMVMRPRISVQRARWCLLGAGVLMIADVVRQDWGAGGVVHPLRIFTGVAVGYAAALGLLVALRGDELAS